MLPLTDFRFGRTWSGRRARHLGERDAEPVPAAVTDAIDAYALGLTLGSAPVVVATDGPAVLRALPLSPPGRR